MITCLAKQTLQTSPTDGEHRVALEGGDKPENQTNKETNEKKCSL